LRRHGCSAASGGSIVASVFRLATKEKEENFIEKILGPKLPCIEFAVVKASREAR
jgi:hypothetical protein